MKKWWQRILALVLAVAMTISIASFDFHNMRFKTKKNQLEDHFASAQAAMEENDYDAAMEELSKCIGFFNRRTDIETQTDIYFRRASILLLVQGDSEAAIAEIGAAIALNPSFADAYALKAQAELNLQDYDAAVSDLEIYIELSGDKQGYTTLAAIYEALGDYEKALSTFDRSENQGAAADYQRGVYLQEAGQTEAALASFERCFEDSDYGAAALYNAGSIRMDLESYETALSNLTASAAAGGDFDGLCFKLGVCKMALGDYEAAAAYFEQSLDTESYEEDARCDLATCLMQLGDNAAALEHLNQVIAANPEFETAYMLRAQAEMNLGDYDAAAADLEKYIALAGDSEDSAALESLRAAAGQLTGTYADYQRGMYLQEAGQTELAAMYFEKCAGDSEYGAAALYNAGILRVSLADYDKAVEDLRAAMEAGSDAEGLRNTLGDTYALKAQAELNRGQYAAAAADLKEYIRLTGDAKGYASLGTVYQAMGDYEKALETVALSGASGASADYQRGVMLAAAGESAAAAEAFEKCAGDSEYGAVGLYNAGIVRMALAEYGTAKTDLTSAMEAGADYDGISFKRGVCSMMLGDYSSAAADFRTSLSRETSTQDARCNLAACLMQTEQYAEAVRELDLLMAEESYPGQAAYFRAVCRWQTEDFEGAVSDFSKCIEGNVMAEECSYNRGLLRLALKDYEGAAADFTFCIEAGFELLQSYYQRAQAYENLGRREESKADYRKYTELSEASA